jgi:hypothetical protein
MLQGRDEDAGKRVLCPVCNAEAVIPGGSHAVTAGDDPLSPRPRPDAVRTGRRRDDYDEDRPRRKWDEPVAGRTSGKARASMILGIIAFPFCVGSIFTGIPAVILGALALSDIGKSGGRLGGKGLAITGLVTGVMGILVVPLFLIGLLLPAVDKVRGTAARMQESNNLKQVAIAMHFFDSTNNGFPQAAAYRTPEGKPLLSWRVALLPYIEAGPLYSRFKLDEPWDSPHNIKLLPLIPRFYQQPGERPDGKGLTRYKVFVGPNTAFPDMPWEPGKGGQLKRPPGSKPTDPWVGLGMPGGFPDGTSNTILVVTAENGVPWTKPEDLVYDPKGPLPAFSKRFSGGFVVALADGSVRTIPSRISEKTLRDAITVNDGNVLGPDW